MDRERFRDILAGIQSIVLSIAVVAGGIWSAYTFGVLRSVEEATAKLESLTVPSLSMAIDTERVKGKSAKWIGLIVRVKVENTGGQNLVLDLRDRGEGAPLKVTLVEPSNDGQLNAKKSYRPIYYKDIGAKNFAMTAIQGVQIKSKKILSYFLTVDSPGIYFIRFQVPLGKAGDTILAQGGITPKAIEEKTKLPYEGNYWIVTTFVELR